jgi:XTP/dITP diphosphohydrolase
LKILLATNNQKKYKEVKEIFFPLKIEVSTPNDLNIKFEVDENGSSFKENAALKSEELFRITNIPSLADDSGICVNALSGDPGIYSARYGKPTLDDRGRAEFLLEKMEGITDRSAYYHCALAFTNKRGTFFVEEQCSGLISNDYDEIGLYGFGYDPIFYFPPLNELFSRIKLEEKNKVSHRGKALQIFYQNYKNGIYE